jgi:hypothetical protein
MQLYIKVWSEACDMYSSYGWPTTRVKKKKKKKAFLGHAIPFLKEYLFLYPLYYLTILIHSCVKISF